MYKSGLETTTFLTGSFHAFLVFSYISAGIFLLLIRKNPKFKFSSIDITFIVFFCVVFISYLVLGKTFTKISYAPLLVIAPYFGIQLLSSQRKIKKFFKYCIFITSFITILSYYELFSNPLFQKSSRFSLYIFPEKYGTYKNPILLAITFSVLSLILLLKIFEGRNKFKLIYLSIFIPSVYLIFRSGSRGSSLAFLVTISFYFLFIAKITLKKNFYIVLFIILLIMGSLIFLPETTKIFYISTIEAQYNPATSIYKRIILINEAFNDFKKSPIWGIGTGNSASGYGSPHNIILEVFVEWGMIGFIIFFIMCYIPIKIALRFIKKEKNQDLNFMMKLSFILFLFFLVRSMWGGYVTNYIGFFITISLISILEKIRKNNFKFKRETLFIKAVKQ